MNDAAAPIRFCAKCGASLARRSGFCGECGQATPKAVREALHRTKAEDQRLQRSMRVMALVFAGTLIILITASRWDLDDPEPHLGVQLGGMAGIAALGTALLGPRAWRACLGRWPGWGGLGLGAAVAAATLAIAYGYTALLQAALASDAGPAEISVGLGLFLAIAVAVPILEEWLCRGVLWLAVRPRHGVTTAVLATAVCFGLLHGLNGAYLFEVPHRLAMGLLLGWLRHRTGSLAPCVLAHAMHNGIVVGVWG